MLLVVSLQLQPLLKALEEPQNAIYRLSKGIGEITVNTKLRTCSECMFAIAILERNIAKGMHLY